MPFVAQLGAKTQTCPSITARSRVAPGRCATLHLRSPSAVRRLRKCLHLTVRFVYDANGAANDLLLPCCQLTALLGIRLTDSVG